MRLFRVMATFGLAVRWSLALSAAVGSPTAGINPAPAGAITFSSHIAGIIHRHCAGCHHEGQAAPFNLLTYEDVRKRAKLVLERIESGAMPPWLAESGYGEFSNERRLTQEEKALIRRWVADGALEGDSRAAPSIPQWPSGWLHGVPDLVVTMDKEYELAPEGPDVYRNFVIRVPIGRERLVRAVEFAPGNPKIVHHAFIRLDEEGQARKLDGRDGETGFKGMISAARTPGGQFLTWNPGSRPVVSPPGLAWKLPKNGDFVVEMHLNRTGKPELLRSSIGLYFTDEQPTNACHTFRLGSRALDFPAGATNEIVRDSMVLPVDLDVLAVYPHAHFLGREMQGYAVLPDGAKTWLVWIKQWDFNWQGEYRFTKPVRLPKGTTLHLQFSYDNSTNNPVNPNQPPKRVVYGEQSSDEMCELGLQVLTLRTNEVGLLSDAVSHHQNKLFEAGFRQRIAANPRDAEALTRLGMILGAEERRAEAWDCFQRAIKIRPDFAEAHHNKGVFLRINGRPAEARREFEIVLGLDPRFPKTHQQLGFAFATLGQARDAERCFEKALELDPTDSVAREGLTELRQILKSRPRNN